MTGIGAIGQVIKKEGTVTGRIGEEQSENLETGKEIDISVEFAKNIHTKFYLNAQSF